MPEEIRLRVETVGKEGQDVKNMKWREATSCSRGDKDQQPTAWTTDIGDLRITVTSNHIYHKGKWVMHCFDVGMDTVLVNAESAETAQRMAVEMVRQKVEAWHDALLNIK